jgi:dipeptidyl-peptidase-4
VTRPALVAVAALAAGCTPHAHPDVPTSTMTWPALDAAFLTASSETLGFNLGKPVPVAFAPDGTLLFRRTPPRSRMAELFEIDPRGNVRSLATADHLLAGADEQLSDADRARRERTRTQTQGIVDVELAHDGARVLIPLGARMFVLDRASGKATAVDAGGYPYDPHLSPDGARIGFVLDGDLYVVDASGGAKPRRLTTRPNPNVEHGVAEFVAQEELDRTRGWWWSPDGKRLAYQRTDATPVDTLYVADPMHPDQPPVSFRYPRAGRPNADVQLGIVSASGGATTWVSWDRAKYPYLADVDWPEHGPLTLVVLDRDQNELAVLAVDDATGTTHALVTEHDEAWVNLPAGAPHWLDDGSGFLWMSEASGEWQLELRDPTGAKVRALTAPGFGLRRLAGVDLARGVAWVLASPDPVRTDVWLVPLDGQRKPTMVTTRAGTWAVAPSRHGELAYVYGEGADGATLAQIIRSDGAKVADVPSVAEAPPWMPHPIIETIDVGGRQHATAILRPRAYDPARRYPVLLHVYGGPHARMVFAHANAYLLDQFYADAGFVVVRIDGRGTPNQGRAWERVLVRDLISIPLADQVDVLHALGAKHPELDLTRVGIYGWSFGGYLSVMAVLRRPDVFRCGIAGAPVTDWSLYDTAYTERYMKQPSENPDGYKSTSAMTYAAELSRPLLIIHGLTDDNVHLANSLALVQAIVAAGKRADFVPMSSTHMVPDPKIRFAQEKLQIDFFREHLGP